jgi:ABC-type transport system substrate-binding protein
MTFLKTVLFGAALALASATHTNAQAPAAPAKKVLRYAFEVAETSLDPAKINDLYSRTLTPHIFEGMYKYDHLARPIKIKPLTADGLPQVSADFRVWTVKIKPGIYFADDPAFKGKKRELVAQDYVYSFKRIVDPATRSPAWSAFETDKLLGLNELRQSALDKKQPFDYSREIEGLRALDRYTFQIKLEDPRPRFIESLANSDILGAVAREVIEFYGDKAEEHPVGTGPFKLAQWRRSSFIAFERNPDFREMFYDAEPAADDAEGQALLARFKGRRLPMVDRVEISVIEEEQPRWLSFVNGEADLAYRIGYQFVNEAMPGGRVAPNLAKRGIRGYKIVEAASNYLIFNMEDPTVGGYTAEKVALRRAVGLGMDSAGEIAYAYNGQGVVAQSALLPFTLAFDPKLKTEFGDYDPSRAKALLDLYGYVDKDGDGWRDMPDGSPLVLKIATEADQRRRKIMEIMNKNMKALGIRTEAKVAQWPENLKAARNGGSADVPDSIGALARYDSREFGGQNMGRFKMPEFDKIYDRLQSLPDGPERTALFDQAQKIALAYMPYKFKLYRLSTDMSYPQLIGYRHPVFWQEFWHYVDIDDTLRPPR